MRIVECKLVGEYNNQPAGNRAYKEDELSVTLRLTNNCNYNCDYCVYHSKEPWVEPKEFYSIAELLYKTNRNNYEFYVHGGEPSLHPEFVSIINYISNLFKDKHLLMQVQTNLSMDISVYLDARSSYLVSYHHHRVEDIGKFLEKLNKLRDVGKLVCIDFMLEQGDFDEVISAFKIMMSAGYEEYLRPRVVSGKEYTQYKNLCDLFADDDRKYQITFEDGGSVIIPESYVGDTNFRFMKCYARRNKVLIEPNGDYYYCMTHKLEGGLGRVKNIFLNQAEFLDSLKEPLICMWKKCFCELDLRKYRDVP